MRLRKAGTVAEFPELRTLLVTKASKSQSGVLVITVLTSPTPQVPGGDPQTFTCQWDCHYCPSQPGQPRSYLRDEPAVRRANQNQFDPILQFNDRAVTLHMNGHPVDKVELLVLGGTWHSYPLDYQEAFIRDLFYAANTFGNRNPRQRKSLLQEQRENEAAACKIIGLTLETRPDCINDEEIRRLRKYGATRVQLGLQHTDPGVLKYVNRGHDAEAAKEAIRLLKDSCYKLDIHLMPNLPGSNPALDKQMFDQVLYDEDLQADQWKIYPCEVVPWTKIEQWYKDGTYTPYAESSLTDVIAYVKGKMHPWIRLNRIVRDIPGLYIEAGVGQTNLREEIIGKMLAQGKRCRCIRCRELGDISGWQIGDENCGAGKRLKARDGKAAGERSLRLSAEAVLQRRHYRGSGGDEYFLSFEAPGEILCGFLRLRLSKRKYYPEGLFPELSDRVALIRELHVYGQLVATKSGNSDTLLKNSQHFGFGARLIAESESIAYEAGYRSMAIIAGVGTKNYYRKFGYEEEGEGQFMIKHFDKYPPAQVIRPLKHDLRWRMLAILVTLFVLQCILEYYGFPYFNISTD